jgi:Cytochrome c7 and related cytochrome c
MANEEKPLEYRGRERDTKGIAQRIALDYLKRPAFLNSGRRKLAWLLVALSLAAGIPMVLGLPGGHRALLSGAVSPSHALFADRCDACHSIAFARVPDQACETCHDGAPHPAKSIDTVRPNEAIACAACHVEHRGAMPLANVANGNCTRCHSDLRAHATGVRLASISITAFRPRKHPEFSALSTPDVRPIRLNHAVHMPAKPTVIRGMKLPMQCTDCHRADPASPTGDPLPVTFEQNCRSCHARELEFDVYELLGPNGAPAPHTKDPRSIHQFIVDAYRQAMAADPSIVRRRLGNDVEPPASAAAWLDKVVRDSESFLFQRKCNYCHESVSMDQGLPIVPKVNEIHGRYVESKPQGEPWLPRGEFSHRAHRAVECQSCHVKARASARTADVLIPAMESCLPCHEGGSAGLDRCSTCHRYHNRSLEQDHRRPTQRVLAGNPRGGVE